MSNPFPLDLRLSGTAQPRPFSLRIRPPAPVERPSEGRRARIWEIASTYHCSIVGTCLSAAELRQLFVRLGETDAKTVSDHMLHGRGVRAAGQHDLAGKMLHKTLDRRHEAAIKRFSKAESVEALRALWLAALEQGEIPGAYWAVMSHPVTDRALGQEAFGEVHMLSHLVGSANRLDLARLRRLERELAERDEKISRQEARLQAGAQERSVLHQRVASLEGEIGRREASGRSALEAGDSAAQQQRLEAERARAAALARRLEEAEGQLRASQARIAEVEAREEDLLREVAALETLVSSPATAQTPAAATPDLRGLTLLYVGGIARLVDQLRAVVVGRGGALLAHDGGVEDSPGLLPGLISRADAAFFPVDCVSHLAAGQVKKHCRDAGKPFVPLRSASLASFVAAVAAERFRPQAQG